MGYSITAAAEVVGVTRQTVSGWKNQDRDFQRYLLLLTDEITADSVARLKQISNRAMDVIEAALSDDSSAALETAMFVLRHVTPATRKPEPRAVSGAHGYWPLRKDYRATYALWGPSVKRERLPEIDMLSIAGRLAAVLGLEFPKK